MARPKGTPIDSSLVSRIADGLRYALTGAPPPGTDWFGPQSPIKPALDEQQAQDAGVAGRQLDYRVAFNVDLRPRSGEAIGFPELRALADSCDILRLVIETRKDQLCGLPWSIQPRRQAAGAAPDRTPACDEAEAFFRSPDREHGWDAWLRMLLEDMFVLDAPTLYVRRTVGGDLYALEPIDGATIKRVIDPTGRTPAEGPAYQQILKGMPAVDYTRDDIIYMPRNVRTHKVYGYSQVEQIMQTVTVAMRRSLFTLDYFTAGTVPDALAGVPPEWTVEQIREFQLYWDTLLSDDMAGRRKLKFVPGEIARNFHETKQPPLKDMFDEWLARIICYCFSIDVTPFVSQVNRAVADTNREQSLSEGLAPIQQWVKGLIDRALLLVPQWANCEFSWLEGEIVDPLQRAAFFRSLVDSRILHPDEARAGLGREPLTPEQKADMAPPAPLMFGADVGSEDGKQPPKPVGEDEPAPKG